MTGHWEKLIGKVEELLDATHDPDNYRMHIQYIIQFSSDSLQRLKSILRLHMRRCVQAVIKVMSLSVSGCASTLVDLQTGYSGYTDGVIIAQLLPEYLTKFWVMQSMPK